MTASCFQARAAARASQGPSVAAALLLPRGLVSLSMSSDVILQLKPPGSPKQPRHLLVAFPGCLPNGAKNFLNMIHMISICQDFVLGGLDMLYLLPRHTSHIKLGLE